MVWKIILATEWNKKRQIRMWLCYSYAEHWMLEVNKREVFCSHAASILMQEATINTVLYTMWNWRPICTIWIIKISNTSFKILIYLQSVLNKPDWAAIMTQGILLKMQASESAVQCEVHGFVLLKHFLGSFWMNGHLNLPKPSMETVFQAKRSWYWVLSKMSALRKYPWV